MAIDQPDWDYRERSSSGLIGDLEFDYDLDLLRHLHSVP
ncbi:hypothetical protein Caka_2631 [Coraliomargarita akajimensis DSM 45221]|uniref:Uncharacterized protein n=1 Tax=Coraliomargarita akajimensis (strain DSM 45221 / IAM 15411 / JCM 23193 / KCTC 12865 / 04OKA010-24) TaxID=583355 RepID=D5EPR4_CORAD|nr:hypothetical protein Caka_2631 [Coraliomargarita akajimensis DSM 45221]